MTNEPVDTLRFRDILQDSFVLLLASWRVEQARDFLKGVPATHVIVHRWEEPNHWHYLYPLEEIISRLEYAASNITLAEALNLRESGATAERDVDTEVSQVPDRAVALDEGRVAGFFDLDALNRQPPTTRGQLDGTPAAFNAYPSLDAPATVRPGDSFVVTVGFQREWSEDLNEVQPISIPEAPPGATLLVMLFVDGGRVEGARYGPLELDMTKTLSFTCKADPRASEVRVTADYIYEAQVVGSATRTIPVTVGNARRESASHAPDPCRLAYVASAAVDLTVTIQKQSDGSLQWSFHGRDPAVTLGPLPDNPAPLDDTAAFAAALMEDFRQVGFRGALAGQLLENKAEEIAALIPTEFWTVLRHCYEAVGRLPTILLRTDEPFIPWELALLEDPLDPALPPFLGAQSIIGRWLRHERVFHPPPVTVELNRATVVASEYGRGTGQRALTQAIAERDALWNRFRALGFGGGALEAERTALEPVLTGQRAPGHLIHFAVHGMSDPNADTQALLLADRSRLPSSVLVGNCRCCDLPTFSFVFLNACQVGTAGQRLGQAAGFPGDLIRRGVRGFVAPLWEVEDDPARTFAERFYEQTLEGTQSVGEYLQAARAAYDRTGSLAPVAYIFYGHPNLRLQQAPPEVNDA